MKVPTQWSEVSLTQYYNLVEAISMDWATDEDKAIAMLSALTSVSIKDLTEKVPVKELTKALKAISFIGNGKPKGHPAPVMKVGKKKYYVDLMMRQTAAENFISMADYTKNKEEAARNIHNIMAMFSHEINWYGGRKAKTVTSQKEMAEYFKENMTMDLAFVYSGFFLRSWKRLSETTLTSLNRKNMKILKEMEKEQGL